MTIQTKLSKLESQLQAKFPLEKPDAIKVLALFLRITEYEMKAEAKRNGEYPYSLDNIYPLKEEWKVTHAEFDLNCEQRRKHMKQFGEKYVQEQEEFSQELKKLIDDANGWKD